MSAFPGVGPRCARTLPIVLLAVLFAATAAEARNQGCCVTKRGCTTATRAVCNALGGTLQGVGSQICDAATDSCVAGVGCASCFDGPSHGELCELPADCGKGGWCLSTVDLAATGKLLDLGSLQLLPTYQYAAKFVCGTPRPAVDAFSRGTYATVINVHNPSLSQRRSFRYKIARALPRLEAGPITDFETVVLEADAALQIDCPVILDRLAEPLFADGFVVLQTPRELDVVAVNTAADPPGSGGQVRSIHTERVPARIAEP